MAPKTHRPRPIELDPGVTEAMRHALPHVAENTVKDVIDEVPSYAGRAKSRYAHRKVRFHSPGTGKRACFRS